MDFPFNPYRTGLEQRNRRNQFLKLVTPLLTRVTRHGIFQVSGRESKNPTTRTTGGQVGNGESNMIVHEVRWAKDGRSIRAREWSLLIAAK